MQEEKKSTASTSTAPGLKPMKKLNGSTGGLGAAYFGPKF